MSNAYTSRTASEVPPRGVEGVKQAILELILSEGLNTGDPIPREADLAESIGVARNTVREAMKALQALGIVEIRHGTGTFVDSGSIDPLVGGLSFRGRLSIRSDRRDARELVEVREALESSLIGRVVELARPDDIKRVEEAARAMEQAAQRGEPLTDLDERFHEALFLPLGNRVLSELLTAFWHVYAAVASEIGEENIDLSHTAADHRAIADAVARRDVDGATAAIRAHFEGIRSRLRSG